jgi:hypothetical protein
VPRTENRTEYEWRACNRFQQQAREDLLATAREAFRSADDREWESLADQDPRLAVSGPPRQLESATADTYLAIDPALVV